MSSNLATIIARRLSCRYVVTFQKQSPSIHLNTKNLCHQTASRRTLNPDTVIRPIMIPINLLIHRIHRSGRTLDIPIILSQTLLPRVIRIDSNLTRSAFVGQQVARTHWQRHTVERQQVQAARQNRRGIELVINACELPGEVRVDVGGEGLVADLLMVRLGSAYIFFLSEPHGSDTNLRRAVSDRFQPGFDAMNLQTRGNEQQLSLRSSDAQARECKFGGFVTFQLAFDRGQDLRCVSTFAQEVSCPGRTTVHVYWQLAPYG